MYVIEERLPGNDHAADRDVHIVRTIVHGLRRRIGKDAVLSVRGVGYQLARKL